jgi:hypothetical protein
MHINDQRRCAVCLETLMIGARENSLGCEFCWRWFREVTRASELLVRYNDGNEKGWIMAGGADGLPVG